MAFANEYRQFDPYAQPGFIKSSSNPAEQGAYLAGAAQGAQAAYAADQQRIAAQAAWEAQQAAAQKAGQATNASLVALQEELTKNEAEITKLKEELSGLTAEYGDQDAVDRALAANRASVGDIGTARAHQQDIQNRMQWRWQMDRLNGAEKSSQKKAEVKALVEKLDNAYSEFAWAESEPQKQVAQNKINRLNKEYEDLTGATFPNPFEAPTGVPNAGDTAKTLDAALAKFNNSKNAKGLPTRAAQAEALKDLDGLPFSAELAAKYTEIKNAKTQEDAAEGAAEQSRKDKKTLDSFLKGKDYSDIEYLYRTKAALPKGVSIEQGADGSLVTKVGKQQKKFTR